MAAAATKKSAVVTARSKGTSALPAGVLGFSSLIVPDEYEGKKSFKMNFHLTPVAIEQLKATLEKGVAALADTIAKEAAEKGANMKPAQPQDVGEWLEDQLKEPKEGSRIMLPFIRLKCPAFRKGSEARGEPEQVPVTIKVWGPKGSTLLDLPRLKVGMGSSIAPIVNINLYRSKAGKDVPQPTIKLVGFRLLKLVQFGGGFAPEETDDAAIREALGGDVDLDEDFSAFAAGADEPSAGHASGDSALGDPDDLAAGMF